MSNTSSRLSKILEIKDITIRALEIKLGASNGTLSKPLKKNSEIGIEWVIKILEFYEDISPDWFLLEKGQMFRNKSNVVEEPKVEYSSNLKEENEKLKKELDDCRAEIRGMEKVLDAIKPISKQRPKVSH